MYMPTQTESSMYLRAIEYVLAARTAHAGLPVVAVGLATDGARAGCGLERQERSDLRVRTTDIM